MHALRTDLYDGYVARLGDASRQFFAGVVTQDILCATGRGIAPWMASVTFGGPDLQTLYIGNLPDNRILYRALAHALPMVHWGE